MMDKMLVIIFENESQVYKGLLALVELQSEGSINIFAKTVIARDADGKVELIQKDNLGPVGATVDFFTDSLISRFGGQVGSAIGADAGAFGRVLFDLARLEVGEDYLSEVEQSLKPGKTAVIAQVWEEQTLAVDHCMEKLGGEVYRSISS